MPPSRSGGNTSRARHHLKGAPTWLLHPKCILLVLLVGSLPTEVASYPEQWIGPYQLHGPANQSVQLGAAVRFTCRLVRSYGINGTEGSRWEPPSVQWIIDGFGMNKETLLAVYGERYHMPGPLDDRVFDLVVSNVQLKDEASFMCQVNMRPADLSTSTQTLTSRPANLTVVVPPHRLSLHRIRKSAALTSLPHRASSSYASFRNPVANVGLSRDTQKALDVATNHGNHRAAADDPGRGRPAQEPKPSVSPADRNLGQANTTRTLLVTSAATAAQKDGLARLWIREGEVLILECRSDPAKPAALISWHLDGVRLNDLQSEASEYGYLGSGYQSNTFANSLGDPRNKYKILNEILDMSNEEVADTQPAQSSILDEVPDNELMRISVSQLHLTVQRHHNASRLQCRVANADEFLTSHLPTAAAIIEPMYIEKIELEISPKLTAMEIREGRSLGLRCAASSNPANPLYAWTLVSNPVNRQFRSAPPPMITAEQRPLTGVLKSIREDHVSTSTVQADRVQLKLTRELHGALVRCWVGVILSDSVDSSVNVSHDRLQCYLSTYDCGTAFRSSERQQVESAIKEILWQKKDLELNVLYGADFPTSLQMKTNNDLYASLLQQTVNLECLADANPTAQVSLYRLGPAGQHFLTMTLLSGTSGKMRGWSQKLRNGPKNRLVTLGSSGMDYFSHHGEQKVDLDRFNQSLLAKVVRMKGSQLLITTSQKIHYLLRMKKSEDFGFYVCMAQNPGFPSVFRHILVKEAGPPVVAPVFQRVDQTLGRAELVCLIQSAPRPMDGQVVWFKNGQPLEPNIRYKIFQEPTIQGVKSTLHFGSLLPDDVATYNCTVANGYGLDWEAVTLSDENGLPLVFLVGSGAALTIAGSVILAVCCCIRYSRTRGELRQSCHRRRRPGHLSRGSVSGSEDMVICQYKEETGVKGINGGFYTPMQPITPCDYNPLLRGTYINSEIGLQCILSSAPIHPSNDSNLKENQLETNFISAFDKPESAIDQSAPLSCVTPTLMLTQEVVMNPMLVGTAPATVSSSRPESRTLTSISLATPTVYSLYSSDLGSPNRPVFPLSPSLTRRPFDTSVVLNNAVATAAAMPSSTYVTPIVLMQNSATPTNSPCHYSPHVVQTLIGMPESELLAVTNNCSDSWNISSSPGLPNIPTPSDPLVGQSRLGYLTTKLEGPEKSPGTILKDGHGDEDGTQV